MGLTDERLKYGITGDHELAGNPLTDDGQTAMGAGEEGGKT